MSSNQQNLNVLRVEKNSICSDDYVECGAVERNSCRSGCAVEVHGNFAVA